MYWLESAILLLILVLAYVYWKPRLRPALRETLEGNATIYFFYTDWCGHSQKAKPEWEALQLPATYGTTKVVGKTVNCESDVTTCTAYGIEGYPTIKVESSDGISDFTQRVTTDNLDKFLVSQFGEKA
jgi:hypothetical protein